VSLCVWISENNLKKIVVDPHLGMHFGHAVATVQSLVGSVKGVQILYSDKVIILFY
jgi:hypothetical protein